MTTIFGKYEFSSSDDNFELYLEAMGTSEELRKIAVELKPTVEIEEVDEQIKITFYNSFKTYHIIFTLGAEFEETLGDGRTCMSLVTLESETRLKHVQRLEGGLELTTYRDFTEAEMICALHAGEITCKRIYSRLTD